MPGNGVPSTALDGIGLAPGLLFSSLQSLLEGYTDFLIAIAS